MPNKLLFCIMCLRVGWLDDRRGPPPILHDLAPLFVYTDQPLRHCIFICSNVHYCG